MWRSFLGLYGLTLSALFVSLVAIILPLQIWLLRTVHEEVGQYASGIHAMVADQLLQRPESEWPSVMRDVSKHFPYGARLIDGVELEALPLSRYARSQLMAGNIGVTDEGHEGRASVTRVGESNRWLVLQLDIPGDLDVRLEVGGVAWLLDRQLAALPDADVPGSFDRLTAGFSLPLTLIPAAEVRDELAQQALNDGLLHVERLPNNLMRVFVPLLEGRYVVRSAPVTDKIELNQGLLLLVPAVLVALAIFFWVRRLWRDASRLNAIARQFGEGRLDQRVTLGRFSVLADTGDRFNRMAADVQRLMDGNRAVSNAVSHDLKTPLARMRFALEMLSDQKRAFPSASLLAEMDSDIAEIESLVEEFLANARYQRQLALHRETVPDLASWLDRLARRHGMLFPDARLSLELDQGRGMAAEMDPAAMARAIGNVLVNAFQYANEQVSLILSRGADQWVLRILDDGEGIAAEDRERVLQPFVRLDDSRHRKGHGLGLAIASQILSQHGGVLQIADQTSQGCRVDLRWPIHQVIVR